VEYSASYSPGRGEALTAIECYVIYFNDSFASLEKKFTP